MNALEALLSLQNSLPAEKTFCQMSRKILQNLDFIKTATIYDVADLCYTSTASIGRLCNRLGYQSFISFRTELSEVLDEYGICHQRLDELGAVSPEAAFGKTLGIIRSKVAALEQMNASDFEKVADVLHQKKSIHYFTHFYHAVFFLTLQEDLTINGKDTYFHCYEKQDMHPGSLLTQDTAALFFVSNLPSESPILQSIREAIQSPAFTIIFTMQKRRFLDNADMTVLLPGSDTSFIDMNLSLYAMELLSSVYRAKYIGPK